MHKAYNYITVCILTFFLILIFIKFNRNSEKYLNVLTILGIVIIFAIIIKSDIFEKLLVSDTDSKYDLILANPPYISLKEKNKVQKLIK